MAAVPSDFNTKFNGENVAFFSSGVVPMNLLSGRGKVEGEGRIRMRIRRKGLIP